MHHDQRRPVAPPFVRDTGSIGGSDLVHGVHGCRQTSEAAVSEGQNLLPSLPQNTPSADDRLFIDGAHVGVALANRLASLVENLQVARRQLHRNCSGVLFQILASFGAGMGTTSSPRPSAQASATWAGLTPRRPRPSRPVGHRQVLCEVLALKAGKALNPCVTRPEILNLANGPGENSPTERTVGHEPDTEFAQGGQKFPFPRGARRSNTRFAAQ